MILALDISFIAKICMVFLYSTLHTYNRDLLRLCMIDILTYLSKATPANDILKVEVVLAHGRYKY